MSTKGRNALVAGIAGLVAAGGVTAIAATQFGSSHKAKIVVANGALVPGGGQGFNGQGFNGQGGSNGQPGLGGNTGGPNGNGGGFNSQQPRLGGNGGGGLNGQPRLGGGNGGPGFGGDGGGPRGGFFGSIGAAATYLGVTAQQLQTGLVGGKTLAQIAKSNGKSVDGLVGAMIGAERKQLDAAVAAGQITKQQEGAIVTALTQRMTAMVNGTRPSGRGFGGGPNDGFGGDDGGGGGLGGGGNFGGNNPSATPSSSFGGATSPA